MLLAEDLLLLLTDDKGRLSHGVVVVGIMLTGANLVELVLMGRVDGRLIVREPAPTDDAVLDAALQDVIASKGGLSVVALPRDRAKKLQETLYRRLVSRGMVRYEQPGILAPDRWLDEGSGHKVEMRRRVIQALVEQTTPDTRTAALIALLHTIEHEPVIVDPRHAGFRSRWAVDRELASTRRQLIARGEEIAKSNWAPKAMRNTIDAIIDAIRNQAELFMQGHR